MTYIIIGLGNFGVALAERLTAMGHEVIGVDTNMNRVEEYKNSIGSTICLNVTEAATLKLLPLDDADEVIVTIGELVSDSVLSVALLKQHGVKRLVARASNPLHRTILEAIGVDEVIMPEAQAAEEFALSLESPLVRGVYEVSETQRLVEMEIPPILVSQTLDQANLAENFGVKLVAVKRQFVRKNLFGQESVYYDVADMDMDGFRFMQNDRIVIFGDIKAVQKICKNS
jgi:trk system potassium uptake protein